MFQFFIFVKVPVYVLTFLIPIALPFIILLLFILGCFVFYFVQLAFRIGEFESFRVLAQVFPPVKKILFSKSTLERYKLHLKNFKYYQELSEADKTKFISRITVFLSAKRIEGNGIKITEEIRVQLAACAVQLLFGLDEFYLPFYDTIQVYPDSFRKGRAASPMETLVTRDGELHISWSAFQKGYANNEDAHNTGLFTFALTMQTGIRLFSGDDPVMTENFLEWEKSAGQSLYRNKGKLISPIPEGAIRNQKQFFATCIEYFFEAPEKLNAFHPQIYQSLCELLRQDPLADNKILPPGTEQRFAASWRKERRLSYLYIFTFVTSILGIPGLIFLLANEVVNDYLLVLLLLIPGAAILIPKLLRPKEARLISKLTIIGTIGFSCWFLAAVLTLNLLIPIGTAKTETHQISSADVYEYTITSGRKYRSGPGHKEYIITYHYSDGAFESCSLFRKFNFRQADQAHLSGNMEFNLQRGIFGIEIMNTVRFVASGPNPTPSE